MWYKTKASEILGIDYPILQGPFGGGLSSVALASTVSNAGGLGGYGAYTLSPPEIYDLDKHIKSATDKPYNLNLWVSDHDGITVSEEQYQQAKETFGAYFEELHIPFPDKPLPFRSRYENQVQTLLDIRPPVFSFVFGIPDAGILEQCRKLGIKTIGAATTLDEAIALDAAGVDLILASGFESGGHRPSFLASAEQSFTGTFVLVQLIRERVKTPVIAAGGIATGAGIAAAFTLGAAAVQIGTAFLACDESGALPLHRQMLWSDKAKYTMLSRGYTGRSGRGLTSRIARELVGKEEQILPFPLQSVFMSSLRKAALEQDKHDMVVFWSGQIAPLLKHTKAATLMQSLIAETSAILAN